MSDASNLPHLGHLASAFRRVPPQFAGEAERSRLQRQADLLGAGVLNNLLTAMRQSGRTEATDVDFRALRGALSVFQEIVNLRKDDAIVPEGSAPTPTAYRSPLLDAMDGTLVQTVQQAVHEALAAAGVPENREPAAGQASAAAAPAPAGEGVAWATGALSGARSCE